MMNHSFFMKVNRQNITLVIIIIIIERYEGVEMDFIRIFKNIVYGMFIGGVQYLPISYEEGRGALNFFSLIYEDDIFMFIKGIAVIGSSLAIAVIFKERLKQQPKGSKKNNIRLWKNILIGGSPSILIGIIIKNQGSSFYDIEKFSYMGIIFAGIAFIIAEYLYKKNSPRESRPMSIDKISFKKILSIGIIQGVFFFLGVSPVIGGMVGCWLIGISTHYGIEYSLISSSYIYLMNIGISFLSLNNLALTAETIITSVLVLLVSFLVALLSMDMLIALGKKKSLRIFAFINILIGVIYLV